jgi:hypothetical protein
MAKKSAPDKKKTSQAGRVSLWENFKFFDKVMIPSISSLTIKRL